jgi:hypothetical protein
VRKLQLNSFESFFLPLKHLNIIVDKDKLSAGDKEHFMGFLPSLGMLTEFASGSLNL